MPIALIISMMIFVKIVECEIFQIKQEKKLFQEIRNNKNHKMKLSQIQGVEYNSKVLFNNDKDFDGSIIFNLCGRNFYVQYNFYDKEYLQQVQNLKQIVGIQFISNDIKSKNIPYTCIPLEVAFFKLLSQTNYVYKPDQNHQTFLFINQQGKQLFKIEQVKDSGMLTTGTYLLKHLVDTNHKIQKVIIDIQKTSIKVHGHCYDYQLHYRASNQSVIFVTAPNGLGELGCNPSFTQQIYAEKNIFQIFKNINEFQNSQSIINFKNGALKLEATKITLDDLTSTYTSITFKTIINQTHFLHQGIDDPCQVVYPYWAYNKNGNSGQIYFGAIDVKSIKDRCQPLQIFNSHKTFSYTIDQNPVKGYQFVGKQSGSLRMGIKV